MNTLWSRTSLDSTRPTARLNKAAVGQGIAMVSVYLGGEPAPDISTDDPEWCEAMAAAFTEAAALLRAQQQRIAAA